MKYFHTKEPTKSKDNTHKPPVSLPKSHIPKVFCPKFTRENPAIWKDKFIDYFLLVDLEPRHWVRMVAAHFEGVVAQWLPV
jgi:hypothetical protein